MQPPAGCGNRVQVFAADSGAQDGHGNHCGAGVERQPGDAVVDRGGLTAPPRAFGKNPDAPSGVEQAPGRGQRRTAAAAVDGQLARRRQDAAEEAR